MYNNSQFVTFNYNHMIFTIALQCGVSTLYLQNKNRTWVDVGRMVGEGEAEEKEKTGSLVGFLIFGVAHKLGRGCLGNDHHALC